MTGAERKAQELRQDIESPADAGMRRWFVVANASRARAYVQRIGSSGYDQVRDWEDEHARFSGGTDRLPHDAAAANATVHTPRNLLEMLVPDLAQEVRAGQVRGFYLLAPAGFLHELKAALPNDIRQKLVGEATGDLTQVPHDQLFARLDSLRRQVPEGVPADAPEALRHPPPVSPEREA
ncbi:MAG: host attachment protein [Acetobacteraceae bacterium]|nr:host attachment protein [Acetobacteraceae bacterium]